MAQRKRNSTNSGASKSPQVQKVSSPVGQPNHSVAEIKERYELEKKNEEERLKAVFAQAEESLRRLKDPNKRSTVTVTAYSRENINTYLANIGSNQANIRRAMLYYYYRSQVFRRQIYWYSTMFDLNCRYIFPPFDPLKKLNPDKIKKTFYNTITTLDNYNIQENFFEVALRCFIEDACFTFFFRDDTGAMFYVLDPSECIITSKYDEGGYGFAMDMSKWKSADRQKLIEWFGSPLKEMYAEYERTKVKYIEAPDAYSAGYKWDLSNLDVIAPPLLGALPDLAQMTDLQNNQTLIDEAAIYKLLAIPMKTLSSSSRSDDFAVSPKLMEKYYATMLDVLPSYVSAFLMPGELTNDDVIDFSTTSSDKDVDRIANSQKNYLNVSGGGAVLGAMSITSTAAFKAWLEAETQFAISSLLPQIQGHTNRFLNMDVAGGACKVKFFEVSVYTKEYLIERLEKACTLSFSDRLAYNAAIGISEIATLSMEYLETNVLDLPNIMNHPLQTSYTTSGDAGRPTTDDDELTPSGERSRNS